jgi:hypothetical protein
VIRGVKFMNQETKRELRQLWFVSEKYFELALREKDKIPQTTLKWTVKILADKCKDSAELSKNKNLIYFVAHLNSCAVRLYSIDENLKLDRWNCYDKLKRCNDGGRIRHEIVQNLAVYIHFLLRHMVAHSESERTRHKNFREAFEAMYDIFFDLDIDNILKSMDALRSSIRNDLTNLCIGL